MCLLVGESLAIIAVIIVMAAMLARAGRRVFAAFTLPFISIPVFHLAGAALRMFGRLLYFDIAGFVAGAALCFMFSRAFRSKRGRIGYLVFCFTFMAALLVAYIINLA